MCCVFCIEYGSALACSDLVEYGYFERENLFVKELLPFLAFLEVVLEFFFEFGSALACSDLVK